MSITDFRRCNWNGKWNAQTFGELNDVTPDLRFVTDPITAGTYGKLVLGQRFVGMDGMVSAVVRGVTLARIRALSAPWWSSGAVSITPPLNVDLYQYAQPLVLHPTDVAAETLDQDLTLLKTVPMKPYSIGRNGQADDTWKVDFFVFPDRSQLEATPPVVVYGYIGAPPSPPPPP